MRPLDPKIKAAKLSLYRRLQDLKRVMRGKAQNASPGQVDVKTEEFTEMYNMILELEDEVFGGSE